MNLKITNKIILIILDILFRPNVIIFFSKMKGSVANKNNLNNKLNFVKENVLFNIVDLIVYQFKKNF